MENYKISDRAIPSDNSNSVVFMRRLVLPLVLVTFGCLLSCTAKIDKSQNSEALYRIAVGDKYGFIDENGKIIIDPSFDDAYTMFTEGVCFARAGNRRGLIDRSGSFVREYPDSISYVSNFIQGFATVAVDRSEWCLIYPDGTIIRHSLPNEGIINRDGIIVVSPQHHKTNINVDGDSIYFCLEGGNDDNNWFMASKNGSMIGEPCDSILVGFKHGLCAIKRYGKWGYMDPDGNLAIPLKYDNAQIFTEDGLARVIQDGKYMYINTSGEEVLTVEKGLPGFKDDRAIAIKDGKVVEGPKIRALEKQENGKTVRYYYDMHGKLIWKDTPKINSPIPPVKNRQNFINYIDDKLSELDPIEGIYYVTIKDYYQDRDDPSLVGLNNSESEFYAVIKNEEEDGYIAYRLDESNRHWVNKFVTVGNSNTYAIMKVNPDSEYSSEGRITIDNYSQFDFQLDRGHNNWYNWFVTYEFIKDYPPIEEIEKIMKVDWTGSGFAIADGYIATNYHVTSGAKTIRIKGVNGNMKEAYNGYVVASDKEHDLSIIKIVDKDFSGFGAIPYPVGKTTVEMGDDIFVLGYPMTSTMGEEVKLTEGIISSMSGHKGDESMYQISAAVQPGNSGGPLFNSKGSVIGIVCGKHSDAENVNYAVKVSYLYSLVNSSDQRIEIPADNHIKGKKLSSKVKKIRNYVYCIECSSR